MTRVRRTALAAATVLAAACLTPVLASPASAAPCPLVTADGAVVPFVTANAPWAGCDLSGANLDGANLAGANLAGTKLVGASLRGAVLRSAMLGSAVLDGAVLDGADLTKADLGTATLVGTSVVGAVLDGASFTGATLTGATLAGADLRGLIGTTVVGAPTTAPHGWAVHAGWLVGPDVDLSGRRLAQLDLHGADLTDANLDGIQLQNVNLRGAVLTGTALHAAVVVFTDLTGATGIATARTSSTTTWSGSICPDALLAEKHDGRSCQRPVDTIAPVVSLTAPRYTVDFNTRMPTVLVENGSGIEGYRERITMAPSTTTAFGRPVVGQWYDQAPTPYYPATWDGRRTCVSLQVRDYAGHLSAWSAPACTDAVLDDSTADLAYAGRWGFKSVPGWIEGSSQSTTRRNDWAETNRPLRLRRLGIVALACPKCGSVALYVAGHKVGAFSLASARTARVTLVLPRWSVPRTGVVRLLVTSPSGRLVRLDGLVVSSL